MTELIVFAMLGLGAGALFAGIALALNLQFQGAGVINLATGAVATYGAYVFYELKTEGSLFILVDVHLGAPWATLPALLVTLALCAVFGALVDLLLFRPLRTAPPLAKLIASLGLLLTLQSVFVLQFGTNGNRAPAILPNKPGDGITIGDIPVPLDRFLLAGIIIGAAILLVLAYRYTRFGLATRAAAESETDAMLAGLSPNALSMTNTVLGFVIAGALGALAAPTTQLNADTISLAVVPALAAAMLAGFRSFGIAVTAGMLMGVVQSLLIYLQTKSWFPTLGGDQLPGVASLFFFLVLVVALLLQGAKLPSRGALVEKRLPPAPEPRRVMLPSIVALVIGVIALMVLPADFRDATIITMLGFIICLSMVVIIGYVGQVSLIQLALAGVAAFAVTRLTVHAGLPFPLPPILAVIAAAVFGLASALPALRVRGVNLAILTLAGAVALEQFGFANSSLGENTLDKPLGAMHFLGLSFGPTADFPLWDGRQPSPPMGLLVLVVAVGLGALVAGVRRSTFGRQMLAVRSNERAATASGISVRRVKLAAFVLAASIAGVAGVLYAYYYGTVTSAQFGLLTALGVVAFAYLGGITTILGAVFGGTMVTGSVGAFALEKWTGLSNNVLLLIGGVTLMFYVVLYPRGFALVTEEQFRKLYQRFQRPRASAGPERSGSGPREELVAAGESGSADHR